MSLKAFIQRKCDICYYSETGPEKLGTVKLRHVGNFWHEDKLKIAKVYIAACDACWTRKGFCGGKVRALEEAKK